MVAVRYDQSAAVLSHLDARRTVVATSQTGRNESELLHRQPAGPHATRTADAVTFTLKLHLLPHRLNHVIIIIFIIII